MQVEHVALEELTEHPDNARHHDEASIAAVAASLDRFGQQRPILIDANGVVLAGNGTYAAARSLGWTHVHANRTELAGAEALAYALADNQTATLSRWEDQVVARHLQAIQSETGTLAGIGFDDRAVVSFIAKLNGPQADPNAIPATPTEPVTQPGDLWRLGRHRLLCGDATNADDVALLLGDARPNLCLTDPPYGVEYDPAWRQREAEKGNLQYAERRIGEVANDNRSDWSAAFALIPGNVIYCWSPPGTNSFDFHQAIVGSGFEIRMQIIWSKPHFPISRGHYHVRHEPCWYAVRRGADAAWIGDRKQTTVWEVALDPNVEGGHSTQKPVELFTRAIANHEGDVYDPFLGSGTALMAAEMAGRTCYGMDISPAYVDVAAHRWEQVTGQKAERLPHIP